MFYTKANSMFTKNLSLQTFPSHFRKEGFLDVTLNKRMRKQGQIKVETQNRQYLLLN